MFEGLVADALTRVLGEYVRGLDKDKINVGVWSGKLELKGLELHPEALSLLLETLGVNAPVTVQAGKIGVLELEVPWKRLRSEPIRVILSELTVLATPAKAAGPEALAARRQRIKLAKLATDEALRETQWSESKLERTAQTRAYSRLFGGVTSRLLTRIMENIRIELCDVIVRFEDSVSDEQQPFCINLELASLRLLSADSEWRVVFVEDVASNKVHKLVQLEALSVRYNHLRQSYDPEHQHSLRSHVLSLSRLDDDHSEFLSPIDGTVRATFVRPGSMSAEDASKHPQINLDVNFPSMEVMLNDFQYTSLLNLCNELARFKKRGGVDRPQTSRERWLWAMERILPGFGDRRKNLLLWTDKGILEWSRRSQSYVTSRLAVLKARRAGQEEYAEQDTIITLEIEDELPVSELIALRAAVDGLLEQEELRKKSAVGKKTAAAPATSSRIASFFRKKYDTAGTANPNDDKMEDAKEVAYASKLMADFEGEETFRNDDHSTDFADALKLQLGIKLRKGSLLLVKGELDGKDRKQVARMELQNLHLGIVTRPAQGRTLIEALIGSLDLYNVKKEEPVMYSRRVEKRNFFSDGETGSCLPAGVTEALSALRSDRAEDCPNHLLAMRVSMVEAPSGDKSLQTTPSVDVQVSIAGLEATVDGPNGAFISACTFWQSRGQNVDAIMTAIGQAAKDRLQALRLQLRKTNLSQQSPVNLDIFLRAPRIFLPCKFLQIIAPKGCLSRDKLGTLVLTPLPCWHCSAFKPGQDPRDPTLFLDFGNLALETKAKNDNGTGPSSTTYVSRMSNLSASISTNLSDVGPEAQILRPLSIEASVEVLDELPTSESHGIIDMARVRIVGVVPSLHIYISQETYRRLLCFIRSWKKDLVDAIAPDAVVGTPGSKEMVLTETPAMEALTSSIRQMEVNKTTQTTVQQLHIADLVFEMTLQNLLLEVVDGDENKFVSVIARKSAMQLTKRQHEVFIDYCLQEMVAEDYLRGQRPRRFVFAGSGGLEAMNDQRTFIHLMYRQDATKMEQRVHTKIQFLDCAMVRETVVAVVRFIYSVQESKDDEYSDPFAAAGTTAIAAAKLLKDKAEVVLERSKAAITSRGSLHISTEFDGLKLLFTSDETGDISSFDMTDLQLNVIQSSRGGFNADGKFGSIQVTNLETIFPEQRVFLEYVGGGDQLETSGREFGISVAIPPLGEGTQSISARFQSLRIVFVQQFIFDLQEYFRNLSAKCQPIISRTKDVEMEVVSEKHGEDDDDAVHVLRRERSDQTEHVEHLESNRPRRVQIAVMTEGIDMIFPRHSKNNHEAVRLTISSLSVDNGDSPSIGYNFAFNLTLNKLSMYALYPLGMEKTPFVETVQMPHIAPILSELDITAKMDYWRQGDKNEDIHDSSEKALSLTGTNPHHRLPAIRIRTRPVDGISMRFCEAEYTVMSLVFAENFIEPQAPNAEEMMETAKRFAAAGAEAPSNKQPPAVQLLLSTSIANLEIISGAESLSKDNALIGITARDFNLNFEFGTDSRISVDLEAKVGSMVDRRPSRGSQSVFVTSQSGAVATLNVSVDRPFLRRSSIMVVISNIRFVIVPELFLQLGQMTIPTSPFLPTSAEGFDMPFTGRSLVLNFIRPEVLLFAQAYENDRRFAVLRGEILIKMMKKAFTMEISLSIGTKALTLSLGSLGSSKPNATGESNVHSETPLLFPCELLFELGNAGSNPMNGRVLHLSSIDAVMCRLAMQDLKPAFDIVQRCTNVRAVEQGTVMGREPSVSADEKKGCSSSVAAVDGSETPEADGLTFFLSLSALRVVFSDEPGDSYVPVMETRLAHLTLCSKASEVLEMSGQLAVDLFDREKGWWVPGIEPWEVELAVHTQRKKQTVMLHANDLLDVNATPVTIDGTMMVLRAFQSAIQSMGMRSSSKEDDLRELRRRPGSSAFVVRNESGMQVFVWTPQSSSKCKLEGSGEEKEMEIADGQLVGSTRAAKRLDELRCFVSPAGFRAKEVSVAELRAEVLTFQPRGLDLVWDVCMRSGLPIGTIRTNYRVINHTDVPLEVQCGDKILTIQKSGGQQSIPVNSLQKLIRLRPQKSVEYDWTAPIWTQEQLREATSKHPVLLQQTHKSSSRHSSAADSPNDADTSLASVPWTLMRSGRALREWAARPGVAWQALSSEPMERKVGGKNKNKFSVAVVGEKELDGKALTVHVYTPLTIENALPKPMSIRLYRRDGQRATSVKTLRLKPLQTASVHVTCNVTELWAELAVSNDRISPAGMDDEDQELVEFAKGFWLAEVAVRDLPVPFSTQGALNTSMARVELAKRGCSLRACFYTDLWLRNRSDTDLEMKVSGAEGTESSTVQLRGRPPGMPADVFLCALGPNLAFRQAKTDKWTSLGLEVSELTRPMELDGIENRNLVLKVKTARGGFQRSLIATVRVGFWLENLTGHTLQWCHPAALDKRGIAVKSAVHNVLEGEVSPVHFKQWGSNASVRIRLAEPDGSSDWIWSCVIDADRARSVPAKMYNPRQTELYIAQTRVLKLRGGSRKLVVYAEDRAHPPYMMVNRCRSKSIAFSQTDAEHLPWLISPGTTSRYSWDDPSVPTRHRSLVVSMVDSTRGREQTSSQSFKLAIDVPVDRVQYLEGAVSRPQPLHVNVSLSGPTKVVTFSDEPGDHLLLPPPSSPLETSNSDLHSPVQTVDWHDVDDDEAMSVPETVALTGMETPTGVDELEKTELSTQTSQQVEAASESPSASLMDDDSGVSGTEALRTLDVEVVLAAVGISIVDDSPEELVYIVLRGLRMHVEQDGDQKTIAVGIQEFQVDNQLPRATWPVMLWSPLPSGSATRSVTTSSSDATMPRQRQFFELTMSVSEADGITTVKGFYSALQEMQVSVDEELVMRIWLLAQSFVKPSIRRENEILGYDDGEGRLLYSDVNGEDRVLHCVYAEQLLLAPIKLTLNLASSRTPLPRQPGQYWGLIRTLIATFGNVENAEFRLNALELYHAFDTSEDLLGLMGEFYQRQLNKQKLTLVASNNLIGNPSVLFDHISTGARDFFVEPYKVNTGAEFLPELYKGSTSFLGNTFGGIMGAMGSIPKALAGTMESAVFDRDYAATRSAIYGGTHRSSKNLGQGLARGAKSLGHGISSGFTGLFRDPIRGAVANGPAGFLRGIGKGVVGGVLKPLTGALDMIAEPSIGLRAAIVTSTQSVAMPVRPPRLFFGREQNRRLITYNFNDSVGADLLSALKRKKLVPASVEGIRGWLLLSKEDVSSGGLITLWRTLSAYTRGAVGQQKGSPSAMKSSRLPRKTRVALVTTDGSLLLVTLDLHLLWMCPLSSITAVEGSARDDTVLLIATVNKSSSGGVRWSKLQCGRREARDELYQLLQSSGETGDADGLTREDSRNLKGELTPEAAVELSNIEQIASKALEEKPATHRTTVHRSVRCAIVNYTDVAFKLRDCLLVSGTWVQKPTAELVPGTAITLEVESGSGLTADIHGSVSFCQDDSVIVFNFVNLFLAEKAYFADRADVPYVVRTWGDVDQEHAVITFAITRKRNSVPVNPGRETKIEAARENDSEDGASIAAETGSEDGQRGTGSSSNGMERTHINAETDMYSTLEQLILLGFDRDTARDALDRTKGDMVAAVDVLLSAKK